MSFLRALNAISNPPGPAGDVRWVWVTLALSALIAVGYGVIACNAYFQSRLSRADEARAAGRRLRNLVLVCCAAGWIFYFADIGWRLWRMYDVALLLLAAHTWTFAWRTRGWIVVGERLARVSELERAAEKYREMAEQLPHMVWTASADGRIDFSNRLWARYAGDSRTWLDAVHPEEREEVRHWWAGAVAARKPAHHEVRLADSAGGYRSFAVSAVPVVHGDDVKWLGACADVEDHKAVAAEQESQTRRKMFFLNALSHDLRAPLNNVVLNAHLLKATARDAAEVESANVIVENAVAAGNLVTRLLEFAKGQGRDDNAAERVSVAATLHQVVRRFLPIAEQKGLYLRLDAAGDVELLTDRQKLERIVSNLVDNAIKFTGRGGVTLELVMSEEPGVAVRVHDTGPGVPERDAPHLFEEFYQGDDAGHGPGHGTGTGFGMGLTICRSLARQLGGDARLVETGPEGSTFEVTIRSTRPAPAPAPAPPRRADPPPDHPDPDDARLCFE
jgi:PAS domain S-box-containing protein